MIVLLQPGDASAGQGKRLAEAEQHHLRVRRAHDGDLVELRDGAGLVGKGRLVQAGRGWQVEVETAHVVGRPAAVMLAVGAGDRERFEWLVEKATELGVTSIVPIETERTAAVATRVRAPQVEKLRRRALEAVKQCGAVWAPEVGEPEPLVAFLARPLQGQRWLADAAGGAPGAVGSDAVVALVGPEGGLTDAESAAALAAGYRSVRLAPHVLRFETAAVAIAVVVAVARSTVPGGAND
jgi:16S rRNA (uracil1498-N3)-methyltransferase